VATLSGDQVVEALAAEEVEEVLLKIEKEVVMARNAPVKIKDVTFDDKTKRIVMHAEPT
jgi:isopentenyl phosphate kinase